MLSFKNTKYIGKKFDKYAIEAPIGEGRFGICFLAKTDSGQKVVLKKFKPKFFKQNKQEKICEAVILSKLNDFRIPKLLGIINKDGFYAFVLELKEGTTVKELLFSNGYKFSQEEFFEIGLKLIKIIELLHRNGIVHRDIRIPNVIINEKEVYLIDFGLARFVNNQKYIHNIDFSYLGDFLIYLLYSSFEPAKKKLPWYEELPLDYKQKLFLKRLLGLDTLYETINHIERDFIVSFKPK